MTITLFDHSALSLRIVKCHNLEPAVANTQFPPSFHSSVWPPDLAPGGTYMRQWLQWSWYPCGSSCCAAWSHSPVSPTPAPLRTPARSPGLRLEYQTGTNSRLSHPHWCTQEMGEKWVEGRAWRDHSATGFNMGDLDHCKSQKPNLTVKSACSVHTLCSTALPQRPSTVVIYCYC